MAALPPDSPQVPPQHKPSSNSNGLAPKPAHFVTQAAAATSSVRLKKPPMTSPPPPPTLKVDQEVRYQKN